MHAKIRVNMRRPSLKEPIAFIFLYVEKYTFITFSLIPFSLVSFEWDNSGTNTKNSVLSCDGYVVIFPLVGEYKEKKERKQ